MNRGTNEHIRNSIWERKINTVCTHHNIDINHLHTLEKQQQKAELKKRMQTSRTQMLLKDNQKYYATQRCQQYNVPTQVYEYSEQETMLSNIQIQKQNAKCKGKLPRQL